jgi:GxxExxY protein
MTHNELSGIIIDAAIEIHRKLGPGLLESVYAVVLAHELRKRGLQDFGEEVLKDGNTRVVNGLQE